MQSESTPEFLAWAGLNMLLPDPAEEEAKIARQHTQRKLALQNRKELGKAARGELPKARAEKFASLLRQLAPPPQRPLVSYVQQSPTAALTAVPPPPTPPGRLNPLCVIAGHEWEGAVRWAGTLCTSRSSTTSRSPTVRQKRELRPRPGGARC